MYSSTFSRKLVNTFSGRCCSLWGRRRDVAVKCWGSSHFQRSLSLHSSSHSGGCRAAFKEPCFKAPRRLRGLKGVPGSVGISLRNCRCVTLGKGALSWRKKSPPRVSLADIEARRVWQWHPAAQQIPDSHSPWLQNLSQALLCFLSMVLTALPVSRNCAKRTIPREKNQYSIVLFLCHIQTERSHLFIVIRGSFKSA